MKIATNRRFFGLLALFALGACDESPTDTAFEAMTLQEEMELSVLADEGAFDVATELSTIATDIAATHGRGGILEARALDADARAAFAEARAAMLAGDHSRALEASRLARRLVARALIATGGVPAVEDLLERLEDLALTIDEDLFDDPDAVRAELEAIVAEARALLASGDSVEAAARAILGEQWARLRRGPFRRAFDIGAPRARLEVQFAGEAVELAERLIADATVPTDAALSDETESDVAPSDVADRQQRWLAHAKRLLERAEMALANGHFARAVHFAQHAQWSALKAVILPGGITGEELRAMVELAESLHEQATETLGDDATELQLRVLERAGNLLEIGIRRLEAGQVRGVAALWRSSVMSAWLIG